MCACACARACACAHARAHTAGAIVVDLDVRAEAAECALKLWRAADAAANDEFDVAYGVVEYPVGTRGMEGAHARTCEIECM